MRPLGEHELSDRGKASLGSCEYTVEVTISSAGAINLVLPSGELLLGAIIVVITCDIWKRANIVPCAHRDFSLLTLRGGIWLPLHLPGLRAALGRGRKEQPVCGCLQGARGPVRPSPGQTRGPTTVPRAWSTS